MIDIQHATTTWITERVFAGGNLQTVLVVETQLDLDAQSPKYNNKAHTEMIESIRAHLKANPYLDCAQVETIRSDDGAQRP